ncbi:MAG: hypothetical protein V1711_00320 [bacterium]
MSIEGGNEKKYSPEEIAEFEKTRVQDPGKALEEGNMMMSHLAEKEKWRQEYYGNDDYVEFFKHEKPTVEDYDDALFFLNELGKEASHESLLIDKTARPMRTLLAGLVAAVGSWPELLALAMGSIAPTRWKEKNRQELIEKLKEMPDNYRVLREDLSSAREKLEKWKAEADEFAKKQNETTK